MNERTLVAVAPSQRRESRARKRAWLAQAKREHLKACAARADERKRLATAIEGGFRCACAKQRLKLAPAPHAAIVCGGCGAWYENGTVTFPKGTKR
jgi:hypothetical protein